jgi:hypothetical protein
MRHTKHIKRDGLVIDWSKVNSERVLIAVIDRISEIGRTKGIGNNPNIGRALFHVEQAVKHCNNFSNATKEWEPEE